MRARGRGVTEEVPWSNFGSRQPASLLAAVGRDNCGLLAIIAKASAPPNPPATE